MIKLVRVLCIFALIIANVTCNQFKCQQRSFERTNTCIIDGYRWIKSETADEFLFNPDYQPANITSLKFINSKVTHIPSGIFKAVEYLLKLDLSGSYVTHFTTLTFVFAWNLRELQLPHNLITKLCGGVFGELKNVELIDLSYNKIETIDLSVFKNLIYLKKLNLSHNFIKIESSNIFPSYLTILNLDYNQITNFSIVDLQNIEQISLNYNELIFLKLNAHVASLHADHNSLESQNVILGNNNLTTLSLKYNKIANFNFINNNMLTTTLSYLDLSNNAINGETNNLQPLTNLTTLILRSSNLSQSDIELFSNLRNLETLDISSNNLSYIDFIKLSRLENLKDLKLNNNNLHTQTFNEFDYLFSNLAAIDISENNWMCAELLGVVKKLKNLKINLEIDEANLRRTDPNIRGMQCANVTNQDNVLDKKLDENFNILNNDSVHEKAPIVSVTTNDNNDGLFGKILVAIFVFGCDILLIIGVLVVYNKKCNRDTQTIYESASIERELMIDPN